jgi:hypothetical protein
VNKNCKKEVKQLTLNKEQDTTKRRLRHQLSMKEMNPFNIKTALKDEELNIDELMNTSYYIYLEEHH